MNRKLLTAPGNEPVTRADAKTYLVIEHTAHDDLVDSLIKAARQHVEERLNRVIIRQKWRLYFDDFPEVMKLEPWTVREIDQIQYEDTDGNTQTVSSSIYTFDFAGQRIYKAYDQVWPDARTERNAVWVDLWAGFYSTGSPVADDVPEALKTAIKMMVGWLYEHRTPVTEMQLYHNDAFEALIAPYRVLRV